VSFWFVMIGIAIDIGIVVSRFATIDQGSLSASMSFLALIALTQVLMVFAIRWILFRLILRHRGLGDLKGFVPLAGVIVIYAMVKIIEFQGFRLWSETGDLGKFLVFLVPSLVLLTLMSPRLLARFQTHGPHRKTGPVDGVVIRP